MNPLERFSHNIIESHYRGISFFGDVYWSEIWLNEGFATYSQGLWIEHTQGQAALDDWIVNKYNTVVDAIADLVPPGKPAADDLFNSGVYDWGALALHALRLEIGDESFFSTLKTFYQDFRNGNVSTGDLINVAEAVSGQELSSFFDRWIYSGELPAIPELGLSSDPTGDERILGTSKDDVLFGRDGDDTIFGYDGADSLIGSTGADRLYGGNGDDTLWGGDGNDRIFGIGGADDIDAGIGDNLIYAGVDADTIVADSGDDRIYAGGGQDTIDSGSGLDSIWLGSGAATTTLSAGDGYDTIHQFQLGSSKLQFSQSQDLSFLDGAEGVQIFRKDDLLAVLTGQSAAAIRNNIDIVFVA